MHNQSHRWKPLFAVLTALLVACPQPEPPPPTASSTATARHHPTDRWVAL
jgi:hypothetical protein